MSKNKIIERREELERELYKLEYLIKHFDLKMYPKGGGLEQFTTWLHMRKKVREQLAGLPTVEDVQRHAKRRGASNSYSKDHKILLMRLHKLLEPDGNEKGPEWCKRSEPF